MDSLSILNGGFHKWLKEVNKTESSNSDNSKGETGKFTVHFNERMLKNYKDMLHIVSTNSKVQQIVDARPPNLFNGTFYLFDYKILFYVFIGANAGHLPN